MSRSCTCAASLLLTTTSPRHAHCAQAIAKHQEHLSSQVEQLCAALQRRVAPASPATSAALTEPAKQPAWLASSPGLSLAACGFLIGAAAAAGLLLIRRS